MLDRHQFENLVTRTLDRLMMGGPAAVRLLLGTAAQESSFGTYLRQIGKGPALGFFQMEPATERDIWKHYLACRPERAALVTEVTGRPGPGPWLEWDIVYGIVMTRMHYYRVSDPLPNGRVEALAAYWKRHYNTPSGSGTVEEFIGNFRRYVEKEGAWTGQE